MPVNAVDSATTGNVDRNRAATDDHGDFKAAAAPPPPPPPPLPPPPPPPVETGDEVTAGRPTSLLDDDGTADNCLDRASAVAKDGQDDVVFLNNKAPDSGGVGHVVVENTRTGAITDPEALDGAGGAPNLASYLESTRTAGDDFSVAATAPAADIHRILALPQGQRAAAIAANDPGLAGIEGQKFDDTVVRRNFGPPTPAESADLQVTFNTPSKVEVEIQDPSTGDWTTVGTTQGGTGIAVPASARVDLSPLQDSGGVWTSGTQNTGSPSLNYRVTNLDTGQVQTGSLDDIVAGGTVSGTVSLTGSTDESGTAVQNGSVTLTAAGTPSIDTTTLSAGVQTEPAAPFTATQLSDYENQQSQNLFNLLGSQPAGSQGQVLYNLLQVIGLSKQTPFQGKVNLDKAQQDASAILNDPANEAELGPLSAQASDEAAQSVLGTSATSAAGSIGAYLTSPALVSYVQGLDPGTRQTVIDKYLGDEASLDTATARQTQQDLVTQMLGGTPLQQLGMVSAAQADEGFKTVLSVSVQQARFGLGVLNDLGSAVSALTDQNTTNLANYFAAASRAGETQGQIGAGIANAVGLTAFERTAAGQIFSRLGSSGLFNAFQAAGSLAAVTLDFTGNNSLPSGGPIGTLVKAGDLSLMLGTAGAGSGQFLQALGLAPRQLSDLQYITQTFQRLTPTIIRTAFRGQPAPDNATLAQRLVELAQQNPPDGDPNALPTAAELAAAFDEQQPFYPAVSSIEGTYYDALSNTLSDSSDDASFTSTAARLGEEFGEYGELAAAAEQQAGSTLQAAVAAGDVPGQIGAIGSAIASAEGDTADQAAGAGALLDEIVPANIAAAEAEGGAAAQAAEAVTGAAGAAQASVGWATLTGVLKTIGLLGPVANGLFSAANLVSAADRFNAGDVPTGTLNTLSAAAFGGAAVTGIVALTAASGPLFPIIGAALGLAGIGFSLASYFTQKSYAQAQENQVLAFLQNGVGNGQSYLNT